MAFQQISSADLANGAATVTKGGTGLSTLTANSVVVGNGTDPVQLIAPGTTGNVLTSNGTNWLSLAASSGSSSNYVMQIFNSDGTWTKPSGLKAIKVTVIGGGGGTGAPGGTSSFGSPAFCSATGGSAASPIVEQGAGGSGSGGLLNGNGQQGTSFSIFPSPSIINTGGSAFGFGQGLQFDTGKPIVNPPGRHGNNYGGGAASPWIGAGCGGGGGSITYIDAPALPGPQPFTVGGAGPGPGPATPPSNPPANRATGGIGVVIIEEFY